MKNAKTEWRVCRDPKSGRTFYSNSRTKETRWNKPLELASSEQERKEMLKCIHDAKEFFKDMEHNIKLKLNNQYQSVDDYSLDIEKSYEIPLSDEFTSSSGKTRIVRTISSIDDEILYMMNSKSADSKKYDKSIDIDFKSIKKMDSKDSASLFQTKYIPRRRNSTGTIYLETTMSIQDDKSTIKCLCTVIRTHMLHSMYSQVEMNQSYDVFKDSPNNNFKDSKQSKSDQEEKEEDRIPTLVEIVDFFHSIFDKAQMESECIIMTLIYCERSMTVTRGKLKIRYDNWKSILFGCMIMSSKVWDDLSMWNVDFSNVCPSYTLARVNALECALLEIFNYEVKVSASEYAKYYFHIRSMMVTLGYHQNEINSIKPLDLDRANKMKLSSEKYLLSNHKIQRHYSLQELSTFEDNQDSNNSRNSVVLEQLLHSTHIDADGDIHTSNAERVRSSLTRKSAGDIAEPKSSYARNYKGDSKAAKKNGPIQRYSEPYM